MITTIIISIILLSPSSLWLWSSPRTWLSSTSTMILTTMIATFLPNRSCSSRTITVSFAPLCLAETSSSTSSASSTSPTSSKSPLSSSSSSWKISRWTIYAEHGLFAAGVPVSQILGNLRRLLDKIHHTICWYLGNCWWFWSALDCFKRVFVQMTAVFCVRC